MLIAAALPLGTTAPAAAADDCPDPLFVCETNRSGKYLTICATELEPGRRWADIQYRFGAEGAPPELAYPADPGQGARSLYFSHVVVGGDYRVTVRFVTGGHTYRVYSHSAGKAGVTVSGPDGRVLGGAACIERPHLFAPYMQQALPCDTENPHGRAACAKDPPRLPR